MLLCSRVLAASKRLFSKLPNMLEKVLAAFARKSRPNEISRKSSANAAHWSAEELAGAHVGRKYAGKDAVQMELRPVKDLRNAPVRVQNTFMSKRTLQW